jgi:dTDP-4-dehydrorhamnose reductase
VIRALLTGCRGQVGTDLARVLGGRAEVVAHDHASLDLADPDAIVARVREARPDVILNAGAYTAVDKAESEPEAAHAVNGNAPGLLAEEAKRCGALLVHFSTDYVFDGTKREPWIESDATSPLGAYGRSKLHGEDLVRAELPDHAIVRTAWLFGPHGPNFVSTMLRLAAERDEVQVVTDQVGSPTFAGHLAPALVDMAERTDTGIFHGAGSGSCSWYELTLEAYDAAGVACRVLPTTAEQFARPAPRPAYSVLGSEREHPITLPPWQEGVRAHLAALEEVPSR